jgi:hypothetical protein
MTNAESGVCRARRREGSREISIQQRMPNERSNIRAISALQPKDDFTELATSAIAYSGYQLRSRSDSILFAKNESESLISTRIDS